MEFVVSPSQIDQVDRASVAVVLQFYLPYSHRTSLFFHPHPYSVQIKTKQVPIVAELTQEDSRGTHQRRVTTAGSHLSWKLSPSRLPRRRPCDATAAWPLPVRPSTSRAAACGGRVRRPRPSRTTFGLHRVTLTKASEARRRAAHGCRRSG